MLKKLSLIVLLTLEALPQQASAETTSRHIGYKTYKNNIRIFKKVGKDKMAIWGTGCPIGGWRFLTAGHIARNKECGGPCDLYTKIDDDWMKLETTFSREDDAFGVDIAELIISNKTSLRDFFEVSAKAPIIGEILLSVVWLPETNNMFPELLMPVLGSYIGYNVTSDVIYHDAMTYPGSSGACVLNEAGEVVSIINGHRVIQEGLRSVVRSTPVWGNKLKEYKKKK